MNRQIKFRAWIKDEKRFITDSQEFIPCIVTNKGILKLQPQFEENYYKILPLEWYELNQYIGLKDKNGVEIYEGDILMDYDDEGYFIVRYEEENARFVLDFYGIKGCLMEYGFDECVGDIEICDTFGFDDLCNIYDFEIVGNIHDGKEYK